jgi:hypothetical protein
MASIDMPSKSERFDRPGRSEFQYQGDRFPKIFGAFVKVGRESRMKPQRESGNGARRLRRTRVKAAALLREEAEPRPACGVR